MELFDDTVKKLGEPFGRETGLFAEFPQILVAARPLEK